MGSDKRIDLEHMIAQKLLEVVSQDDLENTYLLNIVTGKQIGRAHV